MYRNCAAFILGLFLVSMPTAAQSDSGNPEHVVTRYISSQLSRLQLTEDQIVKVRALLAATSSSRRKIFSDVGVTLGQKANWVQLAALKYKIGRLAPKARSRMAKVLNHQQMKIYDKIRSEVEALLKSKLM